jgi:hypothetical protein
VSDDETARPQRVVLPRALTRDATRRIIEVDTTLVLASNRPIRLTSNVDADNA